MMALEEIDFSLWTEVKRQEARNELGVGTIDYSEMSDQELEDSLIEFGGNNNNLLRIIAFIFIIQS